MKVNADFPFCCPQLDVLVTDGGGKTDRQTLVLPVNRNLNKPVMTAPGVYNIRILETNALATSILTVSGSDQDQVCV